ncbi:hypothetical protein ACHAXN_008159 [Cyclotella atomus]
MQIQVSATQVMSTTTPKTSPRNTPIPFPSPSSLTASGLLNSFTKCFDGGGGAAAIDENEQGDAPGPSTSRQVKTGGGSSNLKWGPSHSIDSDDDDDDDESTTQQHKKLTIKTSSSPSRSSSQRTDPTAPITTSTNKGASSQHRQLSLKTGMSGSDGAVHAGYSSSSGVNHTNSGNSKPFWHNFNVSCADSMTGSLSNHVEKNTTDDRGDSSRQAAPSITNTPIHSQGNKINASSSPTSQLISQSAKAAAQAAASVMTMMESLSIQVGSRVGAVNVGGLNVVPFCGSGNSSPVVDRNADYGRMEGILEHNEQRACADTAASNANNIGSTTWDAMLCGKDGIMDNHCFQQFDYNAFRENDKGAADETVGWNSAERTLEDATSQQHESNKGYEIRLKSTFSQQQIKTQRAELRSDRDLLPNLPDSRAAKSPISPATSSFNRTHPNNREDGQMETTQPKNTAESSPASSKAALPIEYLSIPINNSSTKMERSPNTSLDTTSLSIQRTASEVSELTMRSHAERYQKYHADSRRMAYYAVGKVNENDTTGGNRRCYFSGIGIRYGEAFYAGSVRQGPRTLVVFCLPSALGLPSLNHPHSPNHYSAEDRARYLPTLPEPNAQLLNEMKRRYKDPFESLPVQVQSPSCWRLYVKFCYFSGLPIAEGEMHYRVKSNVAIFPGKDGNDNDPNGVKEISLSQDVMEEVNGEESAEILRLPNQKTFDYLRRQYSQQSVKLNEEVFDRKCWEMVMPEI